jgi:hypothetical protein
MIGLLAKIISNPGKPGVKQDFVILFTEIENRERGHVLTPLQYCSDNIENILN